MIISEYIFVFDYIIMNNEYELLLLYAFKNHKLYVDCYVVYRTYLYFIINVGILR